MAEINIGSLSGGGGGGGGGTWLKPEMEGGNNVEITSNQYLRFYKNPATGAYLELNMSGSIPTARIIDSNGNITTIDGNSLDFNSALDPSNPAIGNYLPAQVLIKTFDGGNPAGLYFICLDLNHNIAATLNLIRGTYGGTTGSSDPVEEGMLLGEIAFWGQDDPGTITPGQFNDINKPSRISVYATENYTTGGRGSEMVIYNTEAGTTTQRGNFRLLGTGQNQMELYGVGNFEDNNPAYFVGVDSEGNIIEIDPAEVGPAIGATWLKPEMEAGNDVEITSENYFSILGSEDQSYFAAGYIESYHSDETSEEDFTESVPGSTTMSSARYNTTANQPRIRYTVSANDDNVRAEIEIRKNNLSDLSTPTYLENEWMSGAIRFTSFGVGSIQNQTSGIIESIATEDHDETSHGCKMDFYTVPNGTITPVNQLSIEDNGTITIHQYGSGAKTGTATYALGVNSNGEVIEISTSAATNIYNTSSNLTGNRQLSGDGFSLNIFNTSTFQIEDVTNVLNLEVTPTDVSFFDGAFNFSAADLPANNQIIKMDSGNITGSNVMSETGTAITFAAPLYEIDGSESLPAYSNSGDTDTGMFFPAANEVGFTTEGTEKVRVDALGLVLVTGFTPTGTADAAGVEGAVARDDNYIYVKTSAGWKRAALSTF